MLNPKNNRMRITIIIANPEMGGAQRVSINLAQWLKRNHVEVNIIGITSTKNPQYKFEDIPYIELPEGNKIQLLRNQLKCIRPDVMLSMGVPLSLFTVPASIGLKIKHVISERNDPAHFIGKTSTKVVSRLLMRMADSFVFQTKDAQRYYGGSIAKRSTIIPNPLFNMDRMPEKPFEGERKKVIVNVGRLSKQKNHTLLINAFKDIVEKYPEYKLVIWGEGKEREALTEYIKNKGLSEQVSFPGNTSNVIAEIYDNALFVLSSDFEGMPNALLEAMALGLPCISTKCPCGGPEDIITDHHDGILVPVNDKAALVHAMDEIISDPAIASKLSHNAFAVRQRHAIDTICKKWFDFLTDSK